MHTTTTLKPRTTNGSTSPSTSPSTSAPDAASLLEPVPAASAAPAAAAPAPVRPQRRAAPAAASSAPKAPAQSDLEILGALALAARERGLTLDELVDEMERHLAVARKLLGR